MGFGEKIKMIWKDRGLRGRLLFVLGALVVFRILATIPIPGIDLGRLNAFFSGSEFLSFLNLFSGGGLTNLSIVMLGVGPYITSSIIMQLLTMMSSKIKALYHEEGEAGRAKFTQYSRMLTLPIAILQGFAFLSLLEKSGVISPLGLIETVVNILIITAG